MKIVQDAQTLLIIDQDALRKNMKNWPLHFALGAGPVFGFFFLLVFRLLLFALSAGSFFSADFGGHFLPLPPAQYVLHFFAPQEAQHSCKSFFLDPSQL